MRVPPLRRRATPRPTMSCRITVETESLTCTHTERVKRGSSNRSM
jgi:hypothetical protein